jgi:hypothetical protein
VLSPPVLGTTMTVWFGVPLLVRYCCGTKAVRHAASYPRSADTLSIESACEGGSPLHAPSDARRDLLASSVPYVAEPWIAAITGTAPSTMDWPPGTHD